MKKKIVLISVLAVVSLCGVLGFAGCEKSSQFTASVKEVTEVYEEAGFEVKKIREADADYGLAAILKVSKNGQEAYIYIFDDSQAAQDHFLQVDPKPQGASSGISNTILTNIKIPNIDKPTVNDAGFLIKPLQDLWDSK